MAQFTVIHVIFADLIQMKINEYFFRLFLDKDITNMQYFEAENKTMTFLKQFLYSGLNCVAFYDFNSDSL